MCISLKAKGEKRIVFAFRKGQGIAIPPEDWSVGLMCCILLVEAETFRVPYLHIWDQQGPEEGTY